MNDKTKGKPSKNKTVINQCKINDFKVMIKETLDAINKVLEQRKFDLETWGEKEQDEFYIIFGSKGERILDIDMPIRGVSNIQKMTAREVMQDCIRRLIWIKGQLTLDSFINLIYDPDNPNDPTNSTVPREPGSPKTFAAYVKPSQQTDLKVYIGINFTGRVNNRNVRTCGAVMGVDSRVATLCHEISHFEKNFVDPSLGGMGTLDYESDGSRPLPNQDNSSYEGHLAGADKLVRSGDKNVFNNAYNIERYFQIEV